MVIFVRNLLLLQAEIEIGDGLPDIRLTGQCIEALKKAGFDVSIIHLFSPIQFFPYLTYQITVTAFYWLSISKLP